MNDEVGQRPEPGEERIVHDEAQDLLGTADGTVCLFVAPAFSIERRLVQREHHGPERAQPCHRHRGSEIVRNLVHRYRASRSFRRMRSSIQCASHHSIGFTMWPDTSIV